MRIITLKFIILDFPSILYLRNYSNNKNVENDEKMSAEQHFVLFLWGNEQIFLGHFNENIFLICKSFQFFSYTIKTFVNYRNHNEFNFSCQMHYNRKIAKILLKLLDCYSLIFWLKKRKYNKK